MLELSSHMSQLKFNYRVEFLATAAAFLLCTRDLRQTKKFASLFSIPIDAALHLLWPDFSQISFKMMCISEELIHYRNVRIILIMFVICIS